jgi:hypothetical protein
MSVTTVKIRIMIFWVMTTCSLVQWKLKRCIPKTFVTTYKTPHRHNPKYLNRHFHRREHFRSQNVAPEPAGSSQGLHPEPNWSIPHLHKIHSDPILPSTLWSFKLSLSFGFFNQNPVQFPLLSHAFLMPRPPHSPWFDLSNNIWG